MDTFRKRKENSTIFLGDLFVVKISLDNCSDAFELDNSASSRIGVHSSLLIKCLNPESIKSPLSNDKKWQ